MMIPFRLAVPLVIIQMVRMFGMAAGSDGEPVEFANLEGEVAPSTFLPGKSISAWTKARGKLTALNV